MEGLQVAIEFRPRIRSCHVFVKSIPEPKLVEIKDSNLIIIKFGKENNVSLYIENLNLAKDSVAGLQMTQTSLYFQARTSPEKPNGSFHCELLTDYQLKDEEDPVAYKPDFIVGESANLYCRQCSAVLAPDITFSRLLPLPSSDGSDFFCHGPSSVDLNPKDQDCLYNNFYFKINSSVSSQFPSAVGIMYCPDCQNWLGIKEESSVTLWNSTIKIKEEDTNISEQARRDFSSLVKAILKKELSVACRIIFNSRVDNEEIQYLLLWIMDKNLTLYVNHEIVDGKLTLEETKVAKVLYTHETSSTEIVQQWRDDIRVNEEEISRQMMEEGLNLLNEMSSIIPDPFRKTNQLNVSYIK